MLQNSMNNGAVFEIWPAQNRSDTCITRCAAKDFTANHKWKYGAMKIFKQRHHRKNSRKILASTSTIKPYPSFSRPLVHTVIENWEGPAPEQYEHAYEEYLATLAEPTFELVKARRTKTVRLIHIVERMKELAPEFYDRAISRAGLNQQSLTELGDENDQTHQ